MLGHLKTLSLVLAVNVIAGGTYALTQNSIAEQTASYKANMAPGYDVTGLVFDVNDADPTMIDSISFKISPDYAFNKVNHVEIQTEVDGSWTTCRLVDDVSPAKVAICTFDSLSAEDVTALDIAAE
jgi:hypothetical protein